MWILCRMRWFVRLQFVLQVFIKRNQNVKNSCLVSEKDPLRYKIAAENLCFASLWFHLVLQRSSPMSDLSNVHRSKRRPLPFCSNSQDSPPATNAKPTLLRSQSCCMPPAQLAPTPFSPGAGEESFIGDFSKVCVCVCDYIILDFD